MSLDNDPTKIKAICPHCGKMLRFNSEEKDINFKAPFSEDNVRGQKDLVSWYFYCGCAEGKKWTWTLDKKDETWQYHDWEKNMWHREVPRRKGFVFR